MAEAFAIDRGRIRLADAVLVYLERALAPRLPLASRVPPRAHGVAPMAVSPTGRVLAALAPGEAVWLGFQPVDRARPAKVRVRVEGAEPLDAVSGGPWDEALADVPRNHLCCPPDHWLAGVRTPEGHRPFGMGAAAPEADVLEELTVLAWGARPALVIVELLSPAAFTRQTGVVPEPIDPQSAYKGWRLP